jgi:hypothetical protein
MEEFAPEILRRGRIPSARPEASRENQLANVAVTADHYLFSARLPSSLGNPNVNMDRWELSIKELLRHAGVFPKR